jgi:HK97 family phage portal protein
VAGPFVSVAPTAKSVALQDLPESAWRTLVGSPLDESISPAEVFRRVPWIYRGVVLRASTLANVPCSILKNNKEVWSSEEAKRGQQDAAQPPRDVPWMSHIFDLLYKTELGLCTDAAAYWFRQRNRTRTVGMQWLLPRSITPKFDPDKGLTGFRRALGTKDVPLSIDEVVYWWLPGVEAELGPGVSPVRAALNAAGLLKGIDDFGRGFFDRGAINTTLLSVEGNPPPEELARLEKWWRRMLGGVRRAFETVAIKASIKPVVVGSPPKDMALDTLSSAKRLDVAVALGVPLSLLEDQAANYATARESSWGFLNYTILPEAELIERGLNEQVFGPMGYEFRFLPQRLELMAERRNDQAYRALPALIAGVITGNELRTMLGLEPLPGLDELRAPQQMTLSPTGQQADFPRMNPDTGNASGKQPNNTPAGRKSLPAPAARRTVKRVQRDDIGRIVAVIEDTAE